MNKQNPAAKKSASLRNAWTLKSSVACALAAMGFAHAAPPAPGELPRNGQKVAGQATIATLGEAMTVNQTSQRAILDWQSFNVGSAASVHFNQQQGAGSVTLNRVLDAQPSQIFGRITAPGQVFLVNPGGIYFSPTAKIDVGGLVATTHAIADEDFMAGRYLFERQGAQGSIVNEGELKSALGGYIALLAPEVRNQGVILAQAGTAALAAGETFELQMQGQNTLASISVTPSTIKSLVDNRWAVIAEDGLIILSARAADQLQGAVVNNSGSLVARSLTEKGGRIFLTADSIDLTMGSQIDASGAKGGGTVLIGGDWQGGGGLYQATRVSMASDASVDVSATRDGDGGKAVFWSDLANPHSLTEVHGLIRARGAGIQGRGGQIETSGHRLSLSGIRVDAGASSGHGGFWLLDPADITIDDNPAVGDVPAAAISAALQAGIDVGIDTNLTPCFWTCAGNGDIFINSPIDGTGGLPVSGLLQITADRNIQLASAVSVVNNNMVVMVAGQNQVAGDATGGNIVFGAGSLVNAPLALLFSGSVQDASLANMIGQGSGLFRYNQDPFSFVEPVVSGLYGIYREQPVLQVAPSRVSMVAGSVLAATPTASVSGWVNGDSAAFLTGQAAWVYAGGSALQSLPAGTYDIAYVNGLATALGYRLVDQSASSGELVINPAQPAPLAVTTGLTGQLLPIVSSSGTSLASAELLTTLDVSPLSPVLADGDSAQGLGQPRSDEITTKANGEEATGSRAPTKGKVLGGLMVSPPPVKGFKRAYVVLLDNPDGSTGEIIVKGAKGEQVVNSSGYGVPLDGSVLPQRVSDQLMQKDFSNARKAAADTGAQRVKP